MTDEQWLEKLRKEYYAWATGAQWECCKMVFDLIGGEHHLTAKIKPCGNGIEYNGIGDLATFDFNRLTTAVFMAHDRGIRFSVSPSAPNRIRWHLFKRDKRIGEIWQRHPTLNEAISIYRKSFKDPDE